MKPTHDKGHNKAPSPDTNSFDPCIPSCLDFKLHESIVSLLTKFKLVLSLVAGT